MLLNRVIYQRLYNIAFFVPEIISVPGWEEAKEFRIEIFGYFENNPDAEIALCELATSSEEKNPRRISHIEVKLFLLCEDAYSNLQTIFSKYESEFSSDGSYIDNPAKFYDFIQAKHEITPEMIREKSNGMFCGLRNCIRFYCMFCDCHFIYTCFKILLPAANEFDFLARLRDQVYATIGYSPKRSPGMHCSLGEIATCLTELSKNVKSSPKREKLISQVASACCELYYHLPAISTLPKTIFNPAEDRRRTAISKTKLKNNEAHSQEIKKHIEAIRASSEGKSIRSCCKSYFEEHKEELKMLNINSPRTLQNRLLDKNPNRQRSSFNTCGYICPKYSTTLTHLIESLWNQRNSL